jgi:hypothetical protein
MGSACQRAGRWAGGLDDRRAGRANSMILFAAGPQICYRDAAEVVIFTSWHHVRVAE